MNIRMMDLTLALVIASNLIITCQSAPMSFRKRAEEHPNRIAPARGGAYNWNDFSETFYVNRGPEPMRRPKRNDLIRKWNIRAVQIQLDIIIDRYHYVNAKLEELYCAVIKCEGCYNFKKYIPTLNHKSKTDLFKKRRRHFGKKIYQLLESFHEGLAKVQNSYKLMIDYEDSSEFHNEHRSELLQVFKRDIKMLSFEVEAGMSVKNDDIKQKGDNTVGIVFPFPVNYSDLILQEWQVIQNSKNYLIQWKKILRDLVSEEVDDDDDGGAGKETEDPKGQPEDDDKGPRENLGAPIGRN